MIGYHRQRWLEDAVELARPYFERRGFPLPNEFSLHVLHEKCEHWGECWMTNNDDQWIRISPKIDKAFPALDTLMHELCHAAANHDLGFQCGHNGTFSLCAKRVGLDLNDRPTLRLARQLERWEKRLGPYPKE